MPNVRLWNKNVYYHTKKKWNALINCYTPSLFWLTVFCDILHSCNVKFVIISVNVCYKHSVYTKKYICDLHSKLHKVHKYCPLYFHESGTLILFVSPSLQHTNWAKISVIKIFKLCMHDPYDGPFHWYNAGPCSFIGLAHNQFLTINAKILSSPTA